MADDAKWEKWNQRWGNRVLSHPVRHRPPPPTWLAGECAQLLSGEGLLVDACARLKEISEDPNTTYIRRARAADRNQQEGAKTRFIERVHFGGGWPLMQVGGLKYGALFESHISVTQLDRLEINLPGIVILSMPGTDGRRTLQFGTDVSLSFRLGDFRAPGFNQAFVLHLNVANAWSSVGTAAFGFDNRVSLAGLSVTFKNR